MKKEPLISIVLPSYNSKKYIAITIESILNQDYLNWELIITDDCSTDNTVEILNKYAKKDKRILVHKLNVNSGAAVARNNSLKHCSSMYIAFIDSDDIWDEQKLAIQMDFMLKNNYPISFTSYRLMNESGQELNRIRPVKKSIDYYAYLKNTIIGMSTSMVNTNITGPLQFKNMRTRQDAYLWISLLKKGFKAYGIDNPLVKYRVRNNSISANKISAAKQVWYLYYNLENLGFIVSVYYFIFYAYNAVKKRF